MPLLIDKIEEKDAVVRQAFPVAQMIKLSPFSVVWTNNERRIATLDQLENGSVRFFFQGEEE